MSTTAVAAPDLSYLPAEDQERIALAITQGATWVPEWCAGEPVLALRGNGLHLANLYPTDSGKAWAGNFLRDLLPDYRNDAFAWATLMQREFCAWESDERGHRVRWWNDPLSMNTRGAGPWAPTLPEAIILGTLKKHGVEGYT